MKLKLYEFTIQLLDPGKNSRIPQKNLETKLKFSSSFYLIKSKKEEFANIFSPKIRQKSFKAFRLAYFFIDVVFLFS